MTDLNLTARQMRFLQRLREAHERLQKAMAELDEAAVTSEQVVEGWTVKDMVGHVVSWDEEFRKEIGEILEGKHPGFERRISGAEDFNEWNQRQVERKRDWTWQRNCADLERDLRETEALIEALKAEYFRKRGVTPWKRAAVERPKEPSREETDSVETLVTYHWRHMNQHTRMIERWRRRREKEQGRGK